MFVTSDSNQEPLFYINGEKSNSDAINNLNKGDIETMNVIKGDKAIEKYGKDARYGVIEIITKE
jgi:outer membrane cobalamin receptor